jgi:hypothetical protein
MANSDTAAAAEQCAIDAGAIVKCRSCHEYFVSTSDEEAEQRAYSLALTRRDEGARGFRGIGDEEMMEIIEGTIQDATNCPRCSRFH